MNIILFGATGMVGQGVLRECLLDDRVASVIVVVRTPLAVTNAKLRVLVHPDFTDFSALSGDFASADACFFCIGVTSAGTPEDQYRLITHDYAIAAARALPANPALTFVFVSAAGADNSEQSRIMWARVKGRTENELLSMPLHTYVFRPFYVQAMHGATSKTAIYRWIYAASSWFYPLLQRLMPKYVTTTENMGRAMLAMTRRAGTGERILHSPDINRAAAEG